MIIFATFLILATQAEHLQREIAFFTVDAIDQKALAYEEHALETVQSRPNSQSGHSPFYNGKPFQCRINPDQAGEIEDEQDNDFERY